MPYKIKKLPCSILYKVIDSDTGKIHSHHTTLLKAKAQVNHLKNILSRDKDVRCNQRDDN
jgi:hypothetical protein